MIACFLCFWLASSTYEEEFLIHCPSVLVDRPERFVDVSSRHSVFDPVVSPKELRRRPDGLPRRFVVRGTNAGWCANTNERAMYSISLSTDTWYAGIREAPECWSLLSTIALASLHVEDCLSPGIDCQVGILPPHLLPQ